MKSYSYSPLPTLDVDSVEKAGHSSRKYRSIFTYSNTNSNRTLPKSVDDPFRYLSTACHYFLVFCCYVCIFATGPISLWFCIKRAEQHERVIVFRLGRLQSIKGPSYVFILPWVDKWQKVDLRMRAFIIPPQQLLLSDGAIVEIGAEIRFRIADLVKSVTHVQNFDHSVRVLGQTLLKNIMNHKTLMELKAEKFLISAKLQGEINATVQSWGVEVSQVELSPYKILQDSSVNSSPFGAVMSSFQKTLKPNSQLAQSLPYRQCETAGNITAGSVIHSIMLDQVFPAALAGSDTYPANGGAIFKLCVLSDSNETYWLDTKLGKTAVGTGVPDGWNTPDVSITISASDLNSIIMGNLSPLQAYISGQVLVDGDSQLLYSLQDILSKLDQANTYK